MNDIVLNQRQQKGVVHFLKRKEGDVRITNAGKAIKIFFKVSTVTINQDGKWVEVTNEVVIPSAEIGSGEFQ